MTELTTDSGQYLTAAASICQFKTGPPPLLLELAQPHGEMAMSHRIPGDDLVASPKMSDLWLPIRRLQRSCPPLPSKPKRPPSDRGA